MTLKEKLLKRLPKRYHGFIKDIEAENGLIDNCQYMLYFNDGVSLYGYESVGGYPVKSITEAIHIIKDGCTYDE